MTGAGADEPPVPAAGAAATGEVIARAAWTAAKADLGWPAVADTGLGVTVAAGAVDPATVVLPRVCGPLPLAPPLLAAPRP